MDERKYLVVDDSRTIRIILEDALVALGVSQERIRTAVDGEDALRQFMSDPADVVFLDMEMPRMDGSQAARAILAAEPRTRVVLVTAADRGDPRVRDAIMAGAYEFIPKPVRTEDVERVLHLMRMETRGAQRIR